MKNIKFDTGSKLLTIVLLVSQTFFWTLLHSSVVGKSLLLSEKEALVNRLEEENRELGKKVAAYSSIVSIRNRAKELGLTNVEKTVVLWEGDRFAHR